MPRATVLLLSVCAASAVTSAFGLAITSSSFIASSREPPRTTVEGDVLLVHLAFFDASGELLFSTDVRDLAEMQAVANNWPGPYVLPGIFDPMRHRLANLTRPAYLDGSATILIGEELVGQSVGYSALLPVVGKMKGFDETIQLERMRGPFNTTFTISKVNLSKVDLERTEDTIEVDDLLTVNILEETQDALRVRVDTPSGKTFEVRRTPFEATALLAAGGHTFHLHLDARVGEQFSLASPCRFGRYVLPGGTYLVEGQDEDTIFLRRSQTTFPQLMDRVVTARISIQEIDTAIVPGR